jgi:hypothetical protein
LEREERSWAGKERRVYYLINIDSKTQRYYRIMKRERVGGWGGWWGGAAREGEGERGKNGEVRRSDDELCSLYL